MNEAIPASTKTPKSAPIGSYLFALLLLLTIAAVFISEKNIHRDVMESVEQDLNNSVNVAAQVFNREIESYEQMARLILDTPPIKGLIDTQNEKNTTLYSNSYQYWKDSMEAIFTAFMMRNPSIDQLRIISSQNERGMEIVRVERQSGTLNVVSDDRLQNKADSSYVKTINQLNPGEIYISDIELNREFGRIQIPFNPTIRIGIPIFNSQTNQRFGLLIININAKDIISQTLDTYPKNVGFFITNQLNQVIYHPDDQYKYQNDLRPDSDINAIYQPLSTTVGTGIALYLDNDNQQIYQTVKKTVFNQNSAEQQRTFYLHSFVDDGVISRLTNERRQDIYLILGVCFAIFFSLLILLQRMMTNQLLLSKTRSEHEAVVNGSSDAIIGVNKDFVVTIWNESAYRFFGRHKSETLGEPIDSLTLFNCGSIHSYLHSVLAQQPVEHVELDATSSFGSTFPTKVTFSPITQESGQITGVTLIISDITQQRQAQQEIEQVTQNLEETVKVRTRELAIAHKEALKASQVKSAFISNISHEMRTPLNGIMGTINLIQQDPLSASQRRFLSMMETSSESLYNLINDVLDLSKIEAGKLELIEDNFNTINILEGLVLSLSVKAQQKELEVNIDFSGIEHLLIYGDNHRLKQVIINVFSNAVKFTHSGRIDVYFRTKSLPSGHIRFECEIQDTGIGIAKQSQEHLFEAFSQEHSRTSTRYGGSGLGLSICKQLCKIMDGDITLNSEKGVGSTFSFFTLFSYPTQGNLCVTPSLAKYQAIIFSDDSIQAQTVSNTFRFFSASADVIAVDDYANCEPRQPQIIVLDQGFHNFDNVLDLYQQQRDASPFEIQLLILAQFQDKSFANIHGAKVLSKPLMMSELINAIDNQDPNLGWLMNTHNASVIPEDTPVPLHSGLSVLAVDDNDINNEVSSSLLETMNVNALLATNGREAIEKLKTAQNDNCPVHIILMDCQMPEIDGYSATRLIRNGEAGEKYRHIPIIAMTASAMSGEKERCLDAGMNDYITKPIHPQTLYNKLTQWQNEGLLISPPLTLLPNNVASKPETQEAKPARHSPNMHNTPIWNKENALERMLNNEALLNKIASMFLNTAEQKMLSLSQTLEEGNKEAIRKQSHAIKGLAADLGAERLTNKLAEMETRAQFNTENEFESLYQDIIQEYKLLKQALHEHLQSAA
ncbi:MULTISPECIES: ATP-binding protein [unclassified Vibrio]|uniref:histidine kinase n=1 Tax=Vibrio sp. HB236076 TaxID=3232307 RepID=A0AB39HF52_9VIBR|nr:ATP-binding protein [Vibrio sp. HB161653]MDP5255459.1 ATP-binding protein [Vibrio sp. HB161653]